MNQILILLVASSPTGNDVTDVAHSSEPNHQHDRPITASRKSVSCTSRVPLPSRSELSETFAIGNKYH